MSVPGLVVTVPIRPMSVNRVINSGASKGGRIRLSKQLKAIRALAAREAQHAVFAQRSSATEITLLELPLFKRVSVEVFPWAQDRRYSQDVSNCLPTAKAALDGLVDSRIIPDDTPRHVAWIRYWPHQFGRDALVLVLRAVDLDPIEEARHPERLFA